MFSMSESRAQSPKFEKPDFTITETEDDGLCPPPTGPTTRSVSKKKTAPTTCKIELDLSILLKFIKPYDGCRETLNSFLVNCNNAYDLASEPQKDILFKYILCQLHGKAQTACSVKEFTNWLQLKEFLKTQFSERKHYAHLLTDLQECKQLTNEPVSQYALRIESCLSQLLTEISISHGHKSREMIGRTAAMEELALHHFQMGLTPRISNFIRCKSPKTLNEAVNMAISEEKIQQSLSKQNLINPRQDRPQTSRPNFSKPNFQNSPRGQYQRFTPNFNQPRPNFNPYRPSNYNESSTVCRYCKTPGHTLEQCRKREYNNNRFKLEHNQPRTPQRMHFISNSPEQEYPTQPEEGYDTVDAETKN